MNRRDFSLATLFAGFALTQGHSLSQAHANGRGSGGFGVPPTPPPVQPGKLVIPVEDYFDKELTSDSTEPIGATLVIGVDISGSIDKGTNEYQAQLNAIADSVRSHDFREAIFNDGPGSLAIFIVDYDDESQLMLGGVDFRENHPRKFMEFADRVESLGRRSAGGTNHASALDNAGLCFSAAQSRWGSSGQNFVDIMTDGTGYLTQNKLFIRYLAETYGASVSAMATQTSSYTNMRDWCQENLRTPRNAYRGPDGRMVPAGVAIEVAQEMETRGNEVARYNYNVHQALRNHLQIQASNQHFSPGYPQIRYASNENISSPASPERRKFLMPFDLS